MRLINHNIRQTGALLALGSLIVICLAVTTTWISLRSEKTFDTIVAERDLRRNAADLLSSLQDAEIGQRGYLITRNPEFLAPFSSAMNEIPKLRRQLTKTMKIRRAGFLVDSRLSDLIDLRLQILTSSMAQASTGDFPGARAIVRNGDGKQAMDQIRTVLGKIVDSADERIAKTVADQQRLNTLMKAFAILGALMVLLMIGAAFTVLARQLRALRRAETALQRMNQSLEARVEQRTEDLIKANQEVQRFAYIVTHDLRAPLVNIMGFTSELETALEPLQAYVLADGKPISPDVIRDARLAAAEDLPEALGFIRSSTRKMDGLINAILKISRDGRRELKPEKIDLRALAEQSAGAVAHQIQENGGSVEIDVPSCPITTDRLSLEQALGNLLDNAVKYAQPDRPLHLRIRAQPEGSQLIHLEVEDNGRGIAPEDHERVFELFRRSGRQDQTGEGIGLAHVRSLVRNLGGEITLRSKAGEGSVFILRIPTDLTRVLETLKS